MPKVYFCKQEHNFQICGDTDPKNFEIGRYSACKACRSKVKKEKRQVEKNKDSEEKTTSIDPSKNIRYVVEDTILRTPLLEGETILEKIRNTEEDISELAVKNHNLVSKIDTTYSYLLMYIQKLEAEIQLLKKNNSN
jgi:hypothetical protein